MAKRDTDFLFEIGSLRNVPRAWQQVMTARVQNISEHSFRMTMIAWIIAMKEKADVSKVIQMSLLHDIGESRTGDIAAMHRGYTTRDEELAEAHIFSGTTFEKETLELLDEYNSRETLEAKIVKDADNLDVDLELKELARVGDSAALRMQKDHRSIIRTKKLYTQTAKKMWDEIQKTDSNAWHQELTQKWVEDNNGMK